MLHAASEADTLSAGRTFGAALRAGDVVSLTGPLGSGKTVFAKGIGQALGIAEPVTSPSFIIAQRYAGRIDLYHLDLYRLDRLAEVQDLGFDEIVTSGAVVVIEWGEKAASLLPRRHYDVTFRIERDGGRTITVEDRQ